MKIHANSKGKVALQC